MSLKDSIIVTWYCLVENHAAFAPRQPSARVDSMVQATGIPSSADTIPFSALAFLGIKPGPTQLLLIMPILETTTSFT